MSEADPAQWTQTVQAAEETIQLLDGRWILSILAELHHGPRRYNNLLDNLNGISPTVLTDTLRRVERDRLITRTLDTDRRRSTTIYQLTDLARSLDNLLAVITSWADQHLDAHRIRPPDLGQPRRLIADPAAPATPEHRGRRP
jgi:DNA-binding HxlR family transcriptional regulator